MKRILAVLALCALVGGLGPIATVRAQHAEDDNRIGEVPSDDDDLGTELGPDDEVGEAHEEHETPTISWMSTGPEGEPAFIGRIIAFGLWAFILYWFGRAPLAAFLSTRRRAILDGLQEAKRVEAAANAKHAEYTARIENLDAEIGKLRSDFERAGLEERDRMVAEASARAARMHEEAKFLVGQQVKQLREELTREAIDAAVAAAEKILRERATGADQQRLADEYLARLRTSVTAGASNIASSTPPVGAKGPS